MGKVRVVVEPDSVETTGLGSIVGRIHICVDETAFPEVGWYDFPVVILGWWLDALMQEGMQPLVLDFMDDDCYLKIEYVDHRWQMKAVGWGQVQIPAVPINRESFANSVRVAGEGILFQCDKMGLESRDVTNLKYSIETWHKAHSGIDD